MRMLKVWVSAIRAAFEEMMLLVGFLVKAARARRFWVVSVMEGAVVVDAYLWVLE